MGIKCNDGQASVATVLSILNSESEKNKLDNGGFSIDQIGGITLSDSAGYGIDRWRSEIQGGEIKVNQIIKQKVLWGILDKVDPFSDNSGVELYPFDDSADSATGNNNGVWNGTEQYDDAIFQKGAKFDGNNYITLMQPTTPCTISLHIIPTNKDKLHLFVTNNNHDNGDDFSIIIKNDGLVYFNGGYCDMKTTTPINDLINPFFIEIKIPDNDVNHLKIFVDGQDMGSEVTSSSSNNVHFSGEIILGRSRIGNGVFVADQLRIFNKVLSQNEDILIGEEKHASTYEYFLNSEITQDNTITKYIPFSQRIEGWKIKEIEKKKISLSFDFWSNKEGKNSVALINKTDLDNIETILATFAYVVSEDPIRVEIPFDLSYFQKAFRGDTLLSLELVICGNGATADVGYQEGEYYQVTDSITYQAGDFVKIARAQLEVGDSSPFFANYILDALFCKRYYRISTESDVSHSLLPMREGYKKTDNGNGTYTFDANL